MKCRLLIYEKCNRNCLGCCNKDWDLTSLPYFKSPEGFETIFLTGGEPMLVPRYVCIVIDKLRQLADVNIIVYTAKVDQVAMAAEVLRRSDGMTVTLHEQGDVIPFLNFCDYISPENKSLRLNVFSGVTLNKYPKGWMVKDNIEWIKNCPLPENEVFMRLGFL